MQLPRRQRHSADANSEEKFDLDLDLSPFDHRTSARRGPTMDYRSTEFGVDSSSRFPFRARTDRQTDVTERSIQQGRLKMQDLSNAGPGK